MAENDILELIKRTSVVRKFKNINVPDKLVDRILEAGNWGLSVMGIQPWDFVCVRNKKIINKIADIIANDSKDIPRPFAIIANLTAKTIRNSNLLIAVYNTKKVSARAEKYGGEYVRRVYMAELQSIGGVIQNMCLEASALGLGFAWTDSPAFFDKKINSALDEKNELLALFVLGYPDDKPKRSKRSLDIKLIRRLSNGQ